MSRVTRRVDTAADIINSVSAFLVLGLTLLTFGSVFSRYLLSFTIFGVYGLPIPISTLDIII